MSSKNNQNSSLRDSKNETNKNKPKPRNNKERERDAKKDKKALVENLSIESGINTSPLGNRVDSESFCLSL